MASVYERKRNARKPWAVRYRDANGKQREQSFTRREAADFLVRLNYESRAGIFTDPSLTGPGI